MEKRWRQALGKPLVPVNHLEGHVHAVFLEAHKAGRAAKLPAVCLIVSGGHTVLYEVKAEDSNVQDSNTLLRYRKIGQTRDDAAGEAYDKVAKLLGLGYPGDRFLDRLAAVSNGARRAGEIWPDKNEGERAGLQFSGLKTAVLYHVREHPELRAGDSRSRRKRYGAEKENSNNCLPLWRPANAGTGAGISECGGTRPGRTHHDGREELAVESVLVSGGVAAERQLRRDVRTAFENRWR